MPILPARESDISLKHFHNFKIFAGQEERYVLFFDKVYYTGCLSTPDNLSKVKKIYRKLKYKKR